MLKKVQIAARMSVTEKRVLARAARSCRETLTDFIRRAIARQVAESLAQKPDSTEAHPNE